MEIEINDISESNTIRHLQMQQKMIKNEVPRELNVVNQQESPEREEEVATEERMWSLNTE